MTIVEPIPDVQYGKGDWQDYISNWREKDAEWLQERTVLRYATPAARTTDWGSPRPGHVTYNAQSDRLEMYSSLRANWVGILMFQNLTSVKDDAAGVNISHLLAGGKGATFTPTNVVLDAPITVMGGVLTVDASAVGVQSAGMKKALLTTDSDELLSDTPLVVPGLRLTGTGNVIDATGKNVVVGVLTATSLTVGNINMSGTLTGGVLNGTSGVIGGVTLGANAVTVNAGGVISQQGYFYGDGSSAVIRQRNPSGGALGAAFVQATAADVTLGGEGSLWFRGQTRFMGGRGLAWHNAAGTHVAWGGVVIYSAGDPGAGNYPDGTIWFS